MIRNFFPLSLVKLCLKTPARHSSLVASTERLKSRLKMAWNPEGLSWTEVRDLFRSWREDNERKSRDVVDLWEATLCKKVNKLGDEKLLVLEQVCIAALDCNRLDITDRCLQALLAEFPNSLRVRKLQALKLEAVERYDEALELLDSIIKRDETNAAPRKRRIAILKARGRIPDAIKELTEYLKKFMSDQEGWQELSELYLLEQDFGRAAFCMEELILHNPHNHLIHQRYAEIRYTQGGYENMELARAHYCLALKLNPNSMRALYGLFLSATNIAISPKCTAPKKQEAHKLVKWALKQINARYKERCPQDNQVAALEGLIGSLQIALTN